MKTPQMFSLSGTTALVTGGAGLYGRQLVEGLAEAGATVYTAARGREQLDRLAEGYRERDLDVRVLTYDQADEPSILALRDTILEEAGSCEILVNNAVARPVRDGMQCDLGSFARSMEVNATGLFAITRAFGDAMAERGAGSIINIGSIQGMIGADPWIYEGTEMTGYWAPDYFFHKGGIVNFTRHMASYYGRHGVRCNCVSPGGYQVSQHPPAFIEQYSRKTMLHRLAGDDDLKGVVVFLASPAAAYVTGTNLPVDGGYTAK